MSVVIAAGEKSLKSKWEIIEENLIDLSIKNL